MTQDAGVRDMLHFSIARDTMHQNQWIAAIEQLKEDGLCPMTFPQGIEKHDVAHAFYNQSKGTESKQGR